MAFVTEPPRLSWLIKLEEDPSYCREEVTVLAGSGSDRELHIGTVLGRITVSGKVVGLNLAGNDGSQTVYGVLVTNTTAPQKATITSALIALGIVVRQGV